MTASQCSYNNQEKMKVAQWCRWYQDEWDTWASLLGSGKVSYEQYLLELVWTLSGHLSCHPATIVLTGHMSSWLTVFVHQQVDLHCLCECDSVVNVIVCCGYTDSSLGSPSSMISHWDLSCLWNELISVNDDVATTISSTCMRNMMDPVGE